MQRSIIKWIFIAFVIILIVYFLYKVKNIIFPFIAGAVMAYLLNPAVVWLEKKGLLRRGAVTVVFIWITVLLVLILFLLLPKLYIELGKLAMILPERLQVIYEYFRNVKDYYSRTGLPSEVGKLIDEQFIEAQAMLISRLESIIKNLPGLLASLGLMILSPILAIYFLIDWKRISDGVIKLAPGKMRGEWYRFLQEINYVIQRYIQGNIIDALIVGFLIGTGVKIMGMEYSLIIGVICGITNLIPYFGPVLGAMPSVLLALSKSPIMGIKVLLIIFIIQQIDGNIINPRLMSNKVGLHPLGVVFALLAGGQLGGLLGMLVAIPLAAICKIIFRDIYYYLVSPKFLKSTKK
jgi:predicted PurR-regulated permease PerM